MSGPGRSKFTAAGTAEYAGTSQPPPTPIRLGRLLLEWGRRTYIMGVLNVTPDSFSGDGVTDLAAARARAHEMVAEGADIIDIGGESTRPGAAQVPVAEELRRVIPVIEALAGKLGVPISVDTRKADVARESIRAGAVMLNDVSALRSDPEMAAMVAGAEVSVVLMHGSRTPHSEAKEPDEPDIMATIMRFLRERIALAVRSGIRRDRILIDPGFGFGKTVQQNLDVLRRLQELRTLGQPIVIGTSRKGTIGRVLGGLPPKDRVEGTAATVAVAILNGADIVRVHDVRAMVRVARMTDAVVRQRFGSPQAGAEAP